MKTPISFGIVFITWKKTYNVFFAYLYKNFKSRPSKIAARLKTCKYLSAFGPNPAPSIYPYKSLISFLATWLVVMVHISRSAGVNWAGRVWISGTVWPMQICPTELREWGWFLYFGQYWMQPYYPVVPFVLSLPAVQIWQVLRLQVDVIAKWSELFLSYLLMHQSSLAI